MSAVEPTSTTTPRLDNCKPHCTNIARSDRHVTAMRAEATQLHGQAGVMPGPAAGRLRAHADSLTARADRHDTERTTLRDLDARH